MPVFDMHADIPAAATDLAAGDRFGYDDVSANAGAGGCETIEAEDLLDALLRVASSVAGEALIRRVGDSLQIHNSSGTKLFEIGRGGLNRTEVFGGSGDGGLYDGQD